MQNESSGKIVNKTKRPTLKCRRLFKKRVRRLRRRRSKIRYYESLKLHRYKQNTDNLCESLAVFDIADMEWAPTSSTSLPQDVADWHKQEQLAYWKSRAISLEYENRMLYHHLRHMYVSQIKESDDNESEFIPVENARVKVVPREPQGKRREEEMKKIYGENYAKIMGMETAMQLNFERHRDNTKAAYWPNVPLKL